MTKVAFVGLGRMGMPMARHIFGAGLELVGFDVIPEARQRAAAEGLVVSEDIADVGQADVVCSSLPDTPDVEKAYGSRGGIFEHASPGTVCVDMSTISVNGSTALAARAEAAGLHFLDAPVGGTSIHAEAGTLVVMVGGDAEALAVAEPVLSTFSSLVHHIGPNGAGLQLKLIMNRLLTTHLAAIAEAVVEMEMLDLDVEQGLEILRSGPIPKLLDYKADPLTKRDFTPQFTTDLMRKDLRIATESLPPARLATVSRSILEEAGVLGHGSDDMAALIEVVEAYIKEGNE